MNTPVIEYSSALYAAIPPKIVGNNTQNTVSPIPTFPKKTIDKLGLSNLRIYANIQNLLTITGYDGYDPEIGASTSSVNVYGLDNGRYPSPTVYSFGLNVSF